MSVGAGPNLGGGLWMSGMSDSTPSGANGNANAGQSLDCTIGSGGGPWGGGSPPGQCQAPAGGQAGGDSSSTMFDVQSLGTNPVGSPWSGCGCPPTPGGPVPVAVLTSGSGTINMLAACMGLDMHGQPQSPNGAPINCAELGVTLYTYGCEVTFVVESFRTTYNFSFPGGNFDSCSLPITGYIFGPGSKSGITGNTIGMTVTVT